MAFNASAPNASAYGVFTPTYASKLSQSTGNQGADALNNYVLMLLANQERGQYSQDLRYVNDLAAKAAADEGAIDLKKTAMTAAPQAAAQGIAGSGLYTDDPNIQAYLQLADVVQLDREAAAAGLDTANQIKALVESDLRPSMPYLAGMLAGPLQTTPAELEHYISFDDQSKRISANASAKSAEASMVRANKGVGDGGGGVTISYTPSPYDIPTVPTVRGKNPQAVLNAADQFQQLQGATGASSDDSNKRIRPKPGAPGQFQRKNAKGEWEDLKR